MISTIEAGRTFFVEANEPHEIEQELNAAVDAARQHAMKDGSQGILVTPDTRPSPLPSAAKSLIDRRTKRMGR